MSQPNWTTTDQPNLILNSTTGRYYARYSLSGRRTFKTLKTTKLAVAKQRLRELLSDVDKSRAAGAGDTPEALRMGQLIAQDLAISEADTNLSAATKLSHGVYYRRIQKTWPGFDNLKPGAITVASVRDWVHRLHSTEKHKAPWGKKVKVGYSASAINHSLDKLSGLLAKAVEKGALLSNPLTISVVRELRRKIVPTGLDLPTRSDMEKVFVEMGRCPTRLATRYANVQRTLDNQAANAAEFARFLAYSGARQKECAGVTWEDINVETILICGTKSETSRRRYVPQIQAMKDLILSIRTRRLADGLPITGRVFSSMECQKSIDRACKSVGVSRLTHHDLRHYFATACIESGVDIPTVSRWLGHADGGALCMRTYGHLRQEHSIAAAAKVVA